MPGVAVALALIVPLALTVTLRPRMSLDWPTLACTTPPTVTLAIMAPTATAPIAAPSRLIATTVFDVAWTWTSPVPATTTFLPTVAATVPPTVTEP